MAAACLHVMDLDADTYRAQTDPRCSHINVGTGVDVTIAELAPTIGEVVGFKARSASTRPSPTARPASCSTCSRLRDLGWKAGIDLREGLRHAYEWFLANNQANLRN
jgi:GDP-L-fucose synthase